MVDMNVLRGSRWRKIAADVRFSVGFSARGLLSPTDGKGTINNLIIGNPTGFTTSYALKVSQIHVIYEKGTVMTNFDAIQKNVARYLGTDKNKSSGTGKKLIVEKLTIRNIKAQASAAFMGGKTVNVPLPAISMKNVGKAKGGISPGELGQEMASALETKLTGAVNFNRLMQSTGETFNRAGSTISDFFKYAGNGTYTVA